MRIKDVLFVPNEEWLLVSLALDVGGTITCRVRRNSGAIWSIRKNRGEASLGIWLVQTNDRYFGDDAIGALRDYVRGRDFLGVGTHGQLLFSDGTEAHLSALLEPRDYGDNSRSVIQFDADVEIPGIDGLKHHEST